MAKPSVAVAIPAYNESEGIGEFLVEIDEALAPVVSELHLVVVDDCSTDGTVAAVEAVRDKVSGSVEVSTRDRNTGHGGSLLEAYRRALDTNAEFILAVDGDGQFLGADLRHLLVLLQDGVEGVCGVRRFRYDPWFRMLMTKVLRIYLARSFGVSTRDANCPLRGYRRERLDDFLQWIPDSSLVPNIYLCVLAARRGVTLVEVDVNHRVRRGANATGTMFSSARRLDIMKKLVGFSWHALLESRRFHRDLDSGRRPMASAR